MKGMKKKSHSSKSGRPSGAANTPGNMVKQSYSSGSKSTEDRGPHRSGKKGGSSHYGGMGY